MPVPLRMPRMVVCTSFNRSFKKLQDIVVQLLGHFVLLVYSSLYLSTPSLVLACALPILALWDRHADCTCALVQLYETEWTRFGAHFSMTGPDYKSYCTLYLWQCSCNRKVTQWKLTDKENRNNTHDNVPCT